MINLNTKITPKMETDINNIIFYYNQQKRIHELQDYMTELYNKINTIYNSVQKIRTNVLTELNGEYKDVIDFVPINGKYEVQAVNKKMRDGKLEKVKKYIECPSEHKAINMYLKEHGIKIDQTQEIAAGQDGDEVNIDIDELLGLKDN